jgi:hypothetical protein
VRDGIPSDFRDLSVICLLRFARCVLFDKYKLALSVHAIANAADGMEKIGQGLDKIADPAVWALPQMVHRSSRRET